MRVTDNVQLLNDLKMPPKPRLHKDKGKLKTLPKTVPKASSSSSNSTPESEENQAQFEVELVWCIQQLQSALSLGKLNDKQTIEQTKTLNSLMSNSTPAIRKRQLMRLTFGDYRAKMAEEEKKYLKMNNRIVLQPGTPSKKSVFVKKAPFLTSGKDFKFNFELSDDIAKLNIDTSEAKPDETKHEMKDFQFLPSSNNFRFNFSDCM